MKKIESMSYEESVTELEELLEKLEKEVSLEKSVNYFKRATMLYEHSKNLLEKAEGEVKIILEEGEEVYE